MSDILIKLVSVIICVLAFGFLALYSNKIIFPKTNAHATFSTNRGVIILNITKIM